MPWASIQEVYGTYAKILYSEKYDPKHQNIAVDS